MHSHQEKIEQASPLQQPRVRSMNLASAVYVALMTCYRTWLTVNCIVGNEGRGNVPEHAGPARTRPDRVREHRIHLQAVETIQLNIPILAPLEDMLIVA